jgi:hypothetical protein
VPVEHLEDANRIRLTGTVSQALHLACRQQRAPGRVMQR